MKPRGDEKARLGLPYPSVQPIASPGRVHKRFKRVFLHLFLFLGLGLSYGLWTGSVNLSSLHHKSRSYYDYVRRIEGQFLEVPNTGSALNNSRRFATYPHIAGAASDFDDASQILQIFQEELGITQLDEEPVFPAGSPESRQATLDITSKQTHPSAWIDVYYPVLNTAKSEDLSLQLLDDDSSAIWTADLIEDGNEADKEASTYRDAIAPFHGLSASGEAIGHIVYANYGTKEDYDKLIESGVDLTGKIVLARYGANFRGLKIQAAEDSGAAGVLIYSDPRDDGDVTVENGFLPYP
ncbi:transferrin receptor ectodomain apical domain-containing protein, partial [Coniophora puteana RWD-64-598 SS2]